MFEQYYVIRWTFRYINSKFFYSKCRRFETEQEANKFKFWLMHNKEIEVKEYSKEFVEKWIKSS